MRKTPKFSALWPEMGSEPEPRRRLDFYAVEILTGPRAGMYVHFLDEEDARAYAIAEGDAGRCCSVVPPGARAEVVAC